MKDTRFLALVILVTALGATYLAFKLRPRPAEGPQRLPLPVLQTVPDFSLTDQEGRAVTNATLKGHPYVLDFFFTSCPEICVDMTAKMREVRAALGPDSTVATVSMSVDPTYDTPARLKAYAATNQAAHPRWLFLTGEIRTVGTVMQGLQLAPAGDPSKLDPGQHSSRFVLVDGQGRVRGFYAYAEQEARKRLAADAQALDKGELQ